MNPLNLMRPGIPYVGVDPFRMFYTLTGVTFFAFVTGFSSCLFDLNQIHECVDYAVKATDMLQAIGDHIIAWFIALVQEVFRRYPIGT